MIDIVLTWWQLTAIIFIITGVVLVLMEIGLFHFPPIMGITFITIGVGAAVWYGLILPLLINIPPIAIPDLNIINLTIVEDVP